MVVFLVILILPGCTTLSGLNINKIQITDGFARIYDTRVALAPGQLSEMVEFAEKYYWNNSSFASPAGNFQGYCVELRTTNGRMISLEVWGYKNDGYRKAFLVCKYKGNRYAAPYSPEEVAWFIQFVHWRLKWSGFM
jgi:hypothetical protein